MFEVKCMKTGYIYDMEPCEDLEYVICPDCGRVKLFAVESTKADHVLWSRERDNPTVTAAEDSLMALDKASGLISNFFRE